MAEKINLRSSKVKEQKRRVSEYGTETPLPSTAVERGTTRWLNGSTVVIEGLLDVTGTTQISGRLDVSGATTLSGVTTIAGPTGITGALTIAGSMDVTGPSTFAGTLGINGDTTITGLLSIEGDTTVTGDLKVDGPLDVTGDTTLGGATDITGPTTLKNNLTVDAAKKILLGGLVLENTGAGTANVQMPGGGITASDALGMLITHKTVQIAGQTSVTLASPTINLTATNTYVSNRLTVANTFITQERVVMQNMTTGAAGTPANVHMDSTGRLWRANP